MQNLNVTARFQIKIATCLWNANSYSQIPILLCSEALNGKQIIVKITEFTCSKQFTHHFIWIKKLSWPNMEVWLYEILRFKAHQHQACTTWSDQVNKQKIEYVQQTCSIGIKKYSSPILVTERWAQSWSRSTGSQPAGDFLSYPPALDCHYFLPGLRLYLVSVHQMAPPPIEVANM